jgi:hypothetical protein
MIAKPSARTLCLAALAAASLVTPQHPAAAAGAPPAGEDAAKLFAEAYVYGLPLVLMDTTRLARTAVPKADDHRAPANQFTHSQKFPDPTFTAVVSPNADTLYSSAWLDLSKGPVVMRLPETGNRYYLMQLLDAWTNTFACPGTRTTGNGPGEFAVVGPGWKGELPPGVKELRSPTDLVWLLGRTQTNGPGDYEAVHAVQQRYKLTPLSDYGRPYTPPDDVPVPPGVDAKTPPLEQVSRMEPAAFFARLNALMKDNPPAAEDAAILGRLAAVGVAPGKPFDPKQLDPAVAAGLARGVQAARQRLTTGARLAHGSSVNGWEIARNFGRYETNYPFRALIATLALGANLPEDALYPRARLDSDGRPLAGAGRYVIRFPKGQLPPVNAFWSVTLYNAKQAFVDNPINRYAVGDRDPLKLDNDGSLTLYVQHDSPGKDKEANWLPAPKDEFNLFMRLYWPKKEALDGTWKPPPIKRVD